MSDKMAVLGIVTKETLGEIQNHQCYSYEHSYYRFDWAKNRNFIRMMLEDYKLVEYGLAYKLGLSLCLNDQREDCIISCIKYWLVKDEKKRQKTLGYIQFIIVETH